MDREGFIDFVTMFSAENSRKPASYAIAIQILDEVLKHQNVINLDGRSLYDIKDISIIEDVLALVTDEVKKMRKHQPNIFDYGRPDQTSYPLDNFCSAALGSLIEYSISEGAEQIVRNETNPQIISARLIKYFDLTKEGEDVTSESKRRRGQDYFRRMILSIYGGRCALTGIDIPQVLLASHIIPWKVKSHKKERLNPCNGICLSALYDKAFDKGLITFSPDDYTVVLSSALRENETKDYYDQHFGCIVGRKLTLPTEYLPDREFLAYHNKKIFVGI